MAKPTTRAEVIDFLENMRAVEVVARRGYISDVATFTNFEIVDAIRKIKEDEDRHIGIFDELITMLKMKGN